MTILEIGNRKITSDEFINTMFALLLGHSILDSDANTKLQEDEIEKFSKVIFDLTLEDLITRNTIIEFLSLNNKIVESNSFEESDGTSLKQMITSKLELIGVAEFSNYLSSDILTKIMNQNDTIFKYIENELERLGTTSYENIQRYYNQTFKGFLILSMLFASLPKMTPKKDKDELVKKMMENDPSDVEKFYLNDPQKIVYYYENVNVFNYFTSSEDFENYKMYRLYDILAGVGIDPDNMYIDKDVKGKLIKIPTESRENFYKFTEIEYDKPAFNDSIYEYMKEEVVKNLYDEVFDKIYDSISESVKIKYYENELKTLEKMIRPISRKWFENIHRIYEF